MRGSLINNLMANSKSPVVPVVGMGVTFLYYTDRSAGTIIEVRTDRKIIVQADKAIRVDKNGMSESQKYIFEVQGESEKIAVTLRKNGRWVVSGKSSLNGTAVAIGYREYYHDFSF